MYNQQTLRLAGPFFQMSFLGWGFSLRFSGLLLYSQYKINIWQLIPSSVIGECDIGYDNRHVEALWIDTGRCEGRVCQRSADVVANTIVTAITFLTGFLYCCMTKNDLLHFI